MKLPLNSPRVDIVKVFRSNKQSLELFTSLYYAMSSTNSFRVGLFTTNYKSSTYNRNNRVPNTEPCGTPDLTGSQSE